MTGNAGVHREEVLEKHFVERLVKAQGYELRTASDYHVGRALDSGPLLRFVQETQKSEWDRFVAQYAGSSEQAFLEGVERARKATGTIGLLRQGLKFVPGIKFDVCAFAPASGVNADLVTRYGKNILSVIRQVRYSARNGNEIDVVLFVNGIPVVTIEIKNKPTGTTLRDAENQYRKDRPPANEPLLEFKRGAVVHFALDDDNASMTTRLENGKTKFVPFDRGRDGGAGNPDIPGDFRVGYLWADQPEMPAVFSREVLLQILGSFVHVEKTEDDKGTKKQAVVFPRYHQLAAVRAIVADAKAKKSGQNYLVQHSAGSGKSNTIAWTAHRLISLHDDVDQPVFNTVVIVTDRIVLDRQLQGTVSQFEQTPGLVKKIDGTSRQLKAAIEGGARIIITTIQKFGTEHVKELAGQRGRTFAVLVDEAHGSQSGANATALGAALGGGDPSATVEEAIAEHQRSRGPQPNVSYVAFTATPRNVTLERFGRPGPGGRMRAFHAYPMRQAIEEGFILDVLQSYMTYKAYYSLEKAVDDDPEMNVRRARPKVARFASLHPTAVDQKVWVIVEHFRRHVMADIGGQAKAMVVTASREHALRYHQSMRDHIAEQGYTDMKALVAFSGELEVDGHRYTEAGINGFSETELPGRFDAEQDCRVLIVAEKYQTGFDQPKLAAMYVDRKLAGLQAVQTLSRLNRTTTDKRRTFILDFQNEVEDIKGAFEPFYQSTTLSERSDLNQVYVLENKLRGSSIIDRDDVEAFARIYFKGDLTAQDRIGLQALLRPAIDRFEEEDEGRQEEFRSTARSFSRFYAFVAQIVSLSDTDIEKLDAYVGYLLRLLPEREVPGDNEITDDMVRLRAFRLVAREEQDASLTPTAGRALDPITEFGGGIAEEEEEALSEIVRVFNDRHGTDFRPEDMRKFEEDGDTVADDEDMTEMLRNNPRDVVFPFFNQKMFNALVRRMQRENKLGNIIMTDPVVRERLTRHLFDRAVSRTAKPGNKASDQARLTPVDHDKTGKQEREFKA
ncbi:type I restriction endonuclease subunit R [Lichenibacterium ramalinae]|uniref:Type I restriction endonuclease subunit R n=1 Tax=Lichenibacterium ramalinae TaxID=2316527 RepID=A0A4Q2R6X5_9HYPH|nr:type I restriction endonuclease subunit R [Lichenibacterium ramalinae]